MKCVNFVFLTDSVNELFASLCELPDYHIHSSLVDLLGCIEQFWFIYCCKFLGSLWDVGVQPKLRKEAQYS